MASSSHNTFEGVDDEDFDQYFDQHFDQYFDQTFKNFPINYGDQDNKGEEGKNEFISKQIVKKVMYVYGMIISVKLQCILKIYSNDNLE